MPVDIQQLHPLFAAEVHNLALTPEMTDAEITTIKSAIDEHAVVVFRGQTFDDDSLLGFGKRFGNIAAPNNHRSGKRLKHGAIADISNLDADGTKRNRDDARRLDGLANQLWHADASFRPIAGEYSMLYAHVVPPSGGNTEFTDLRAAYDALDADLKTTIEDLVAEHSIIYSRGLLGYVEYTADELAAVPPVRHPIVRTHPGSGRKTLYLGSHAARIIDWPVPEGRLLLRDLIDHATERRFVHAHEWQAGDLVIWDNRCTMHRGRRYDDANYTRDLRRVTTQDMTTAGHNPELLATG